MALLFFSKNNKIKFLALHEYMNKEKGKSKERVKEKGIQSKDY